MLLYSFSADDCSSCVERSFKVHELVEKACHEYDFGKKRVMEEIKQPPQLNVFYGRNAYRLFRSWTEHEFLPIPDVNVSFFTTYIFYRLKN